MNKSKSAKRYIEFKHINDQEPLRVPMTRSSVSASAQKIKPRQPVFVDHDCECNQAPNSGSTQDYPWPPTEYVKNS